MGSEQHPAVFRRLRGYAFDPFLSQAIETVDINEVVYRIPWESLTPGPVGEYVEVVDYDPAIERFYTPVDLDDLEVVANDGLDPGEGNPHFHQQMVYAVAMTTIRNFEKALGRKILWAPRELEDSEAPDVYVRRLRLYPHALREANAFYMPRKKAILFGYFSAAPGREAAIMPGAHVFTCLSHDIIAHEVTHAILDGLHRNYIVPSNRDMRAFHEAFADIVALFQHFTFPDVLKHQVAKTQGSLDKQNLLGQLAKQLGTAVGRYGSLRDALGDTVDGQWKRSKPDPEVYKTSTDPYKRGSILVAAVFDAFLAIYRRRVSDLLRIATGGTGVLPEGQLSPDLVNRLSQEASKTAKHVLTMCIRALDYCPPVDLTFGDFLRALITADRDVVAYDQHHYRLAFIEAFRRRGIYPEGVDNMSEESLVFPVVSEEALTKEEQTRRLFDDIKGFLQQYTDKVIYEQDRGTIFETSQGFIAETLLQKFSRPRDFVSESFEFQRLTGLVFNRRWRSKFKMVGGTARPDFEILNLRLVSRVGPDGDKIDQIIFNLVQRMGVFRENGQWLNYDLDRSTPPGGFVVHGGSTLIFDLYNARLKYAIAKPLIDPVKRVRGEEVLNEARIEATHRFRDGDLQDGLSDVARYFDTDPASGINDPFAFSHKK